MSRVRKTAFQRDWLAKKDENGVAFEAWLAPVKDNEFSAHCKQCNKTFRLESSGIRAVTSHAEGMMHKKRVLSKASCSSLMNYVIKDVEDGDAHPKKFPLGNVEVMKAELRSCFHYVEHDLSFVTADHSDVYQQMFPDSNIAKAFKCKRTKVSYLLNDAITPCIREEIVSDLTSGSKFYSLGIDESNDCSGSRKFLAVMVSYVSSQKQQLIVCPLQTQELADGSAETLQKAVLDILLQNGLPLKNCVSIMSDGPKVMTGRHSGFHVRMESVAPHLLRLTTCTLHHVCNAVRAGCDDLGGLAEKFADDIFGYFIYTSRWTRFKHVQEILEVTQHRMLRRVETRWIQLLPVVDRLIEQWQALKRYFLEVLPLENAQEYRNNDRVASIKVGLRDPNVEMDIHFLKNILPILNKFQKVYQREDVLIHTMYNDVRDLFVEVLVCFLQEEHVVNNRTRLRRISFDADSQLADDRLFIGESTKKLLQSVSTSTKTGFFTRVRQFYVSIAKELQHKLPLSDGLLRSLRFLNPQVKDIQEDCILNVAKALLWPDEKISTLTTEWRLYRLQYQDKEPHPNINVVTHWLTLSALKDTEGAPRFILLSDIALACLTILHGNAAVERTFSQLEDLLRKKRNRLEEVTIDSCLCVAGYLKAVNLNCATVPISSLMVEKGFNARAAYKERMKTDQENKVNEAAIAERKRHLDEQLKDEMERSVKRQKLMEAEKAVLDKKSQLVVEENAARSMIEEYQKKMALIAEQRKEVDQQEKKLASQKKAEDSKILQLTLAKAAK